MEDYIQEFEVRNNNWGEFGYAIDVPPSNNTQHDGLLDIDLLYIHKDIGILEDGGFDFLVPTACSNALRVLRTMQLPKYVPLDASLGVRKTNLMIAWGKDFGLKEALEEGCWLLLDELHLAQQFVLEDVHCGTRSWKQKHKSYHNKCWCNGKGASPNQPCGKIQFPEFILEDKVVSEVRVMIGKGKRRGS